MDYGEFDGEVVGDVMMVLVRKCVDSLGDR